MDIYSLLVEEYGVDCVFDAGSFYDVPQEIFEKFAHIIDWRTRHVYVIMQN